ncbi:MAG TPA: CueP family metal-binding protein [Anaerolineaceae bacterium]|nr:CueP family metal-binding protein [Anaerolineaceae bacterium]
MRKSQGLIITALVTVVVIAVAVFLVKKPVSQSDTAFLEKYGLSGLSIEEIVQKLDSTTSDLSGLRASITSDYLILSDDSGEVRLALPKDKFYLSFAPYISQTHPCGTHSLTSCQGELVNQEIHAVITDKGGNEIVNSDLTTMANGFVGVWLPRKIDGTVSVSYNGKVAQAPISTYAGSNTCLTTALQLN